LFQQFGDGTFELGQSPVDLDHLVRADGLERVDVVLMDCPLHAALAPVEQVAITVRAVDVDRGVPQSAATDALGLLLWFLL